MSGCVRAQGWLLIFDGLADYKPPTWPVGDSPKQMHFEWMVDDVEHAVDTLRVLGASAADHQHPDERGVRVMLDPAGHPFC